MNSTGNSATRAAMEAQLAAWPHLDSPEHAAHRAILLAAADALDRMIAGSAHGRTATPPMQIVQASKALFGLLERLSPEPRPGHPGASEYDVSLPLFDE